MSGTLFVTTGSLRSLPAESLSDASHLPAVVLDLHGGGDEGALPAGWRRVAPEDLVAASSVRRRFLDFLEAWPAAAVESGRSFTEMFTVDGGYSIWWTSVGGDRQATHGVFTHFRTAALLDAAIRRFSPTVIWLLAQEPLTAALVETRATRSGILVQRHPAAEPLDRSPGRMRRRWILESVRQAITAPLAACAVAWRCRRTLRSAALFRRSPGQVVVFASPFPRYLEIRRGTFSPMAWNEICAALNAAEPSLRFAFLPWNVKHAFEVDSGGHTARRGVDVLDGLRAPLLVRERFSPLKGAGRRFLRQLSATWRFYQLARTDGFRRSCEFAGTDMAEVIRPELQRAIAEMTDWSLRRAQFARALRAAGDVRAVVLSEEMYRPAMPLLAAAADLGIPTVGVQHGTIMPAHLIYTPPRGHVDHAPTPDYFAAYGEYAKSTMSEHGAYPVERVWVTGAARLDPLVNCLEDQASARASLGLPADTKVVVLATQTFPWFAAAIRAVLECMRSHPEAVLCIRKHPSKRAMSIDAIQALAREVGADEVRSFDGDINPLLSACDVWISASSTTILEATLVGKRTICVNFSGEPDGYPYVDDGASLPARSVRELHASLERALGPADDPDLQASSEAFLRKHAGPTGEGRAALTFARRLADLLARR